MKLLKRVPISQKPDNFRVKIFDTIWPRFDYETFSYRRLETLNECAQLLKQKVSLLEKEVSN